MTALFNETMGNAHRLVQAIQHLPHDIRRRIAYRVSPKDFDTLVHETWAVSQLYYPPRMRDCPTDLRAFGVKVIPDAALTEILPVLKDYGSSG